MPALGFPKPKPKLLEKRERAKDTVKHDRIARAYCRLRSGGRCEVRVWTYCDGGVPLQHRCKRRASENHHLLGGMGRRNRGRSLFGAHRLDVCKTCHSEITGHVLQPVGTTEEREAAATVRYVRVK